VISRPHGSLSQDTVYISLLAPLSSSPITDIIDAVWCTSPLLSSPTGSMKRDLGKMEERRKRIGGEPERLRGRERRRQRYGYAMPWGRSTPLHSTHTWPGPGAPDCPNTTTQHHHHHHHQTPGSYRFLAGPSSEYLLLPSRLLDRSSLWPPFEPEPFSCPLVKEPKQWERIR